MKICVSSSLVSHKCLLSFYCTNFQDLKNFLGPTTLAIFWRRGLCSTRFLWKTRTEISYMLVDKYTLEVLWKINLTPRWAKFISEQHRTALWFLRHRTLTTVVSPLCSSLFLCMFSSWVEMQFLSCCKVTLDLKYLRQNTLQQKLMFISQGKAESITGDPSLLQM